MTGIRTSLILLLALSACSSRQLAAGEKEKPVVGKTCPGDANEALAEKDAALSRLAMSGGGDPAAQAKRALAAGDSRFLGYSMLIPGIEPAAYGIECRPDLRLLRQPPMRAVFAGSDVAADIEAENLRADNFGRFAKVYNATLLADSRYAYGDICRAAPDGYQPALQPPTTQVSDWGFRDRGPTAAPVDLGEAARRGSLASLQTLIAAHPEAVNTADMFGMTPLAWAIAYRRDAPIAALLDAGASPVGAACGYVTDETAPIRIARSLQWRSLLTRMLPRLGWDDLAKLKDAPHPDPAVRVDFDDFRKVLKGNGRIAMTVDVDARGRASNCVITRSNGDPGVDRRVCAAVIKRYRWLPARDEYGDPIAGQAYSAISF